MKSMPNEADLHSKLVDFVASFDFNKVFAMLPGQGAVRVAVSSR